MADSTNDEGTNEAPSLPEGATPEAAKAAADWGRKVRDSQVSALRDAWGGDDAAVERGMESAAYAVNRLGITDEERAAHSGSPVDEARGLRLLRDLGEGLRHIDESMTPADARERIRELQSDADFRAKLLARDRKAKKLWDGLNAIAFYTRPPDSDEAA